MNLQSSLTSKQYPLVSIIIPTYNRGSLLLKAVESVLEQTYQNIECIVVDDCSTDNSMKLLKEKYHNENRLITIYHKSNRHASAARNSGIDLSKGQFIAFLDDDDIWYREKLAKQVSLFLSSSPSIGLVYCWLEVFKGAVRVDTLTPRLRGNVFDQCLAKQPLGNASTILVKKEVIDKIGLFDITLPRGNDGDFIRRVAQHYEVDVIEEFLVGYFVEHKGNPRISLNTVDGIKKSVFSQEVKLIKFSNELKTRPNQHQLILLSIVRGYVSIGKFSLAFKGFFDCLKINPFFTALYISPIQGIKDGVFRFLKR